MTVQVSSCREQSHMSIVPPMDQCPFALQSFLVTAQRSALRQGHTLEGVLMTRDDKADLAVDLSGCLGWLVLKPASGTNQRAPA